MDTPNTDKNLSEARVQVYYDEPARKAPPSLSVGPVGWMRANLFSSSFDTVLTVISAVVIVAVTLAVLGWSIRDANWLVINQNFRNFMAGTFPLEASWRLNAIFLVAAFATGFSVATYSRSGRDALIVIGIMLALLFAVPLLATTVLSPPNSYLSVGEVAVESGTITESPVNTIAFTASAGANVRIQIADFIQDDASADEAVGFTDRATNAYINAAINRLEIIARINEIERILAANEQLNGTLYTQRQINDFQEELAELQEENLEPVTERYAVNSAGVSISVLDATGEALGSAQLSSGDEPFTVRVPETGWYILDAEVDTPDVLVILETQNTYPLLERGLTVNVVDENGEPIVDETIGRIQTESVIRYLNIYEQQTIADERPVLGEEEVPIIRLTDNQFRGERSFKDYVVLGVGPLFDQMNLHLLFFSLFMVAGYGASVGMSRVVPKRPGGSMVNVTSMANWGLFTFLTFLLTIGIEAMGGLTLGIVTGLIIWVGVMFFLGMNYINLDNTLARALLGLAFVLMIGQLVGWRVLTETQPAFEVVEVAQEITLDDGTTETVSQNEWRGWAVSGGFIVQLALWTVIGVMALRYGQQNEDKLSAGTRTRGLIGSFVLWLAALVLLPVLINGLAGGVITNYRSENLLPIARFNLWGGFLLTFMLTAVGIVASFPLGVLLALGRRAHRYPVVKYACILYIEFVRGVPLITVLFMATLLVPLLNPALATVSQVIRAMIGITMFSAAYLAENVRGGLQSIPPGQEEAGKAVGLNNVQVTTLIMLPQALRAVIPALVGQAIALFKDTSLVIIVGLSELTGVAQRVVAQAEFVGLRLEAFFFISVIYFIFSYLMSFISRRIEESGSGSALR